MHTHTPYFIPNIIIQKPKPFQALFYILFSLSNTHTHSVCIQFIYLVPTIELVVAEPNIVLFLTDKGQQQDSAQDIFGPYHFVLEFVLYER